MLHENYYLQKMWNPIKEHKHLLKNHQYVEGMEMFHPEEPERVEYTCCENDFVEDNCNVICKSCGKIVETFFDDMAPNFNDPFELLGLNNGYVYIAKRFYKPINHFRDHLKRYIGGVTHNVPPNLFQEMRVKVDVLRKDAYTQIHKILKKNKLHGEYKHIWSIIIDLGGFKNDLTNQEFHTCLNLFRCFLEAFQKIEKGVRKSLPSHYMMLKCILDLMEIPIYYDIPVLKNRTLRNNIECILKKCQEFGQISVKGLNPD